MKAIWNTQVQFWYVLRFFYAGLLIFVLPLFLITIFNASHDPAVAALIVVGSVIYFAAGYAIFVVLPKIFEARLDRIAASFWPGFRPDFVVRSSLLNSYIGVDNEQRSVVYVDLASGTQAHFEGKEVVEWEVEGAGKNPALLKLSTLAPALPSLALRFNWRELGVVTSNLKSTFG